MYLTIMRPEALSLVRDLVLGLLPISFKSEGEQKSILIVKITKEGILAAAMKKGFSLYLAPCNADGRNGLVLISAFFDDDDEPLAIRTPIIEGDPFIKLLLNLPDQFVVCFFDELNREMMSCKASANLGKIKNKIRNSSLLPVKYANEMFNQSSLWFGNRTDKDDEAACNVKLLEDLFPNDFIIQDLRMHHNFHGSSGHSMTQLRRKVPGVYQEQDIIFLLQRFLPSEQIYHGPLKVSDDEELVDILITTSKEVILIQAKDSPNTEEILKSKISRKRARTKNKLTEGFSQIRGALSTIRNNPILKLRFKNSDDFELDFSGRQLIGIVIVKELFDDTFAEYSEITFKFMERWKVPSVFFDYGDFSVLTRHCTSEHDFLNAIHQVFRFAMDNGEFCRLNFPNPPPESR